MGRGIVFGVCFVVLLGLFDRKAQEPVESVSIHKIRLDSTNQKDLRFSAFLWLEKAGKAEPETLRIALVGEDGPFRAFVEKVRLELRTDQKEWTTTVAFERTKLSQEVISAEVTHEQALQIQRCLDEVGYPSETTEPDSLRISLGRVFLK
jgi:hypothetical protein